MFRRLALGLGQGIVATSDTRKLDATTCLSVVGQMYKCITRLPPRASFGSGPAGLPHSELVRQHGRDSSWFLATVTKRAGKS